MEFKAAILVYWHHSNKFEWYISEEIIRSDLELVGLVGDFCSKGFYETEAAIIKICHVPAETKSNARFVNNVGYLVYKAQKQGIYYKY